MESSPAIRSTRSTRGRARVIEQVLSLLRGRTLYVSGATDMLDHPEFWDIESTRDLLRMFEDKERLAELMCRLPAGGHARHHRRREPGGRDARVHLITSTYMYRDQVLGILGVVGPAGCPTPR